MLKKSLLLGMLLVLSILVVGCTKNVYYTSPVDSPPPPAHGTELPTLSPVEEIAILKSWGGAVLSDSGRTAEDIAMSFEEIGVDVLGMYKGELIFRGRGYNYFVWTEFTIKEWDDFSPETKSKIEHILGSNGELNSFEKNLIEKYDGSWVRIVPGGDGMVIVFEDLENIKGFLDWWSTL